MFTKFYEKLKRFISDNYLLLSFYLVIIATLTYPLPYYIYTGGGVIDTASRVEVSDGYLQKGSLHLAYVSELQATIPTYLLAKVLPNWDIESIQVSQVSEEETMEEILVRDHLYLEEANTAAIFTAYQKASKPIQILKKNTHVIYIHDREKTNLQIGDIVQTIDGVEIENFDDIRDIVARREIGDQLEVQVLRNQRKVDCYATLFLQQGEKIMGISILQTYDYELKPNLTLKFRSSESGPSGGMMLALTIYNQLVEEDVTRGRKIVGTGTIDMDGNVGSIGGVTYKLAGAVKNHADIFIVPNGENYEDCMKMKEEKHFEIRIIGVDTFDDVLLQLKK